MKLDGMWKFKKGTYEEGIDFIKAFPSDADTIAVPSCWDNSFDNFRYEGGAWYKTDFYFEGGNLLVRFNAVLNYAKVFLDGEFLTEHYGGFTAFEALKKGVKRGNHSLVVFVDNTHNQLDTMPLYEVDWYHYGGISRSVEIFNKADLYIENARIDYELTSDLSDANVWIRINVKGEGKKKYTLSINGEEMGDIVLEAGRNTHNLLLENVCLWDIDNPVLYTFSLKSNDDTYTKRTGFRKIEVKGYDILLNNKKITFKGVNRHEEHPDWGFAMPNHLNKKDLDIICNMNCNVIRGSHYPNSQDFLDMLDERGMLFWSEIPLWQYHDEQMSNENLKARAKKMMEEMIDQYHHHPSIVIWGLLNECDTFTETGKAFTKMLYDTVKENDESRLITFASDKKFNDISLEYCDFISINNYTGWYEGEIEDWGEVLDKMNAHFKAEGVYHKPLVISEFGTATLYGEVTFEESRWSENYQDNYMKGVFEEFSKRENIAGTFIWQYADIRVYPGRFLTRARCFNNKGILNEYRKPKMAYYTVKEIYGSSK